MDRVEGLSRNGADFQPLVEMSVAEVSPESVVEPVSRLQRVLHWLSEVVSAVGKYESDGTHPDFM